MKKVILVFGGILVFVLLGAYIGVTYFMGSIVKAGVDRIGPRLTQSDVNLASAKLSPLTGIGTLSGLSVGNPKGWSDGRAFYLGSVHFDVEPKSIFSDPIVINELVIDQPEFAYETKIVSSNIKDLLNNIEAFTGSGAKATTKSDQPPKKFILKKFRLTNGKATLGVGPAALPLPLPPISLDNIGVAEGGVTGDQLAVILMREVLTDIASSAAGALVKTGSVAGAVGLQKTGDAVKKAGESIKKLFGKP